MERDDFNETIRAFKNQSPFRPFTVGLVDGDKFEVDFPGALAVRDGVAVYLAPGNIPVFFDHEGVSRVIGDLSQRPSEESA